MTNLERAIDILAKHREARNWTDEAVAHDLLKQLGLTAGDDVRVTEAAHHEPEPTPPSTSIAAPKPVAPVAAPTKP